MDPVRIGEATTSVRRRLPRVLIVHHANVLGGAEISLRTHLARARACDYALATPSTEWADRLGQVQVRKDVRLPMTYRGLTGWSAPGVLFKGVLELLGLCRRFDPDLLVSYASLSMPATAALSILTGRPCVWHARELPRRRFPVAILGRIARSILVPSESSAAKLKKRLLPRDLGKVHVIVSPIEEEHYTPMPAHIDRASLRLEHGLPPDGEYVLMVGQHVPWKGHLRLLEALPALRARRPNVRLLLVGEAWTGTDAPHSASIAESARRYGDWVHLRRASASILPYYWISDLLVLPSDREPLGRAALEALLAGAPAVASENAGIGPVLREVDPCLVFDPHDVESLVQAIVGALSAPPGTRNGWIAEGRRIVSQRFSSSIVVPQIEDAYIQTLGQGSRPS